MPWHHSSIGKVLAHHFLELISSNEEHHHMLFEKFCARKIVRSSGGDPTVRSKTISRSRGEDIIKLLKDLTFSVDAKFNFWVKRKGFKLLSYPPLGLVDVLCLPARTKVCYTVRSFATQNCRAFARIQMTIHF